MSHDNPYRSPESHDDDDKKEVPRKFSVSRVLQLVIVAAILFSYAIVVGIYLTPRRVFGLPDESVSLILERVSLIPSVVGPVAGLVALFCLPGRQLSQRQYWYYGIAILGILTPVLVPAIASP